MEQRKNLPLKYTIHIHKYANTRMIFLSRQRASVNRLIRLISKSRKIQISIPPPVHLTHFFAIPFIRESIYLLEVRTHRVIVIAYTKRTASYRKPEVTWISSTLVSKFNYAMKFIFSKTSTYLYRFSPIWKPVIPLIRRIHSKTTILIIRQRIHVFHRACFFSSFKIHIPRIRNRVIHL